MIQIGIIGYGYWGPNILRNFSGVDDARIQYVCDINPEALKRVQKNYNGLKVTLDCKDVIESTEIDAVAIITPVATHYELTRRALLNGKHVFVEKPFTETAEQAEELISLALQKNLLIMIDHTFLFTGAVRKIKELVQAENTLGRLYYFDSTRVNLGLFQHDVNVVWDLAPHDLSIMDYLIKETPMGVITTGEAHFNHDLEDVAYITIYFPNRLIAHINVNWLSPVKIRTTLIGGHKKMLVWNDLDADEKIRIYDKGVDITNSESIFELLVSYRSGDVWVPRIDKKEALKIEAEYFLDCIRHSKAPINDGAAGLRIVKMLQAANASLKKRGALVYL